MRLLPATKPTRSQNVLNVAYNFRVFCASVWCKALRQHRVQLTKQTVPMRAYCYCCHREFEHRLVWW